MTQALMRQVEETSNSSKETRWIRERDLSKCREIVVSFSNAQLGVKLVNARIEGKNKNGCKYAVVLAEVQCNSDAAHVRGVHRPSIDGRSVVTVSTSIVSVLLSLCLYLEAVCLRIPIELFLGYAIDRNDALEYNRYPLAHTLHESGNGMHKVLLWQL